MQFKFKPDEGKTCVRINKMEVARIVPSVDHSYVKIFLATEDGSSWRWSVLKKTFKRSADAQKWMKQHIDEILRNFKLYPISIQ